MATSKKRWTRYALTGHMLKRLASLQAGVDHGHGTSMSALKSRGLAEDGPLVEKRYGEHGFTRKHPEPCCVITDKGREALAEARRLGW